MLLGAGVPLAKAEGHEKHANITEITVHPDWERFSKTSLDADIAILVLDNSVTLTHDVQVVCLPSDGDVIDDAKGFIAGWDLEQRTPKHSIINVFNYSYCLDETHILSTTLPSHTFCGGAERASILKTVTGGGFFISSGSDPVWVQYGVAVSVTNGTGNLNDQKIVSLMNVALFKTWIVDTVRQSGGVVGEAITGRSNLECNFVHLYYSYVVSRVEIENTYTIFCRTFRYACVAYGLNVQNKNFGVDRLIGSHEFNENNDKVELIQFHNGTMFYLVDGIGRLFPNLKSFFVGYSDSDSDPLNTTLIRRSNFLNMENLFEIAIHKSDIAWIYEDLLWDLPNLERFQLDGILLEIPERTFENNAKLKEVYLAANALVFLPKNLFKNNLDLKWVNLANNSLLFIQTDFRRLPNILYIFLAGNLCINQNFNKTAEQVEDRSAVLNENNNSDQVGEVMQLQRLIDSNCTLYT